MQSQQGGRASERAAAADGRGGGLGRGEGVGRVVVGGVDDAGGEEQSVYRVRRGWWDVCVRVYVRDACSSGSGSGSKRVWVWCCRNRSLYESEERWRCHVKLVSSAS